MRRKPTFRLAAWTATRTLQATSCSPSRPIPIAARWAANAIVLSPNRTVVPTATVRCFVKRALPSKTNKDLARAARDRLAEKYLDQVVAQIKQADHAERRHQPGERGA